MMNIDWHYANLLQTIADSAGSETGNTDDSFQFRITSIYQHFDL